MTVSKVELRKRLWFSQFSFSSSFSHGSSIFMICNILFIIFFFFFFFSIIIINIFMIICSSRIKIEMMTSTTSTSTFKTYFQVTSFQISSSSSSSTTFHNDDSLAFSSHQKYYRNHQHQYYHQNYYNNWMIRNSKGNILCRKFSDSNNMRMMMKNKYKDNNKNNNNNKRRKIMKKLYFASRTSAVTKKFEKVIMNSSDTAVTIGLPSILSTLTSQQEQEKEQEQEGQEQEKDQQLSQLFEINSKGNIRDSRNNNIDTSYFSYDHQEKSGTDKDINNNMIKEKEKSLKSIFQNADYNIVNEMENILTSIAIENRIIPPVTPWISDPIVGGIGLKKEQEQEQEEVNNNNNNNNMVDDKIQEEKIVKRHQSTGQLYLRLPNNYWIKPGDYLIHKDFGPCQFENVNFWDQPIPKNNNNKKNNVNSSSSSNLLQPHSVTIRFSNMIEKIPIKDALLKLSRLAPRGTKGISLLPKVIEQKTIVVASSLLEDSSSTSLPSSLSAVISAEKQENDDIITASSTSTTTTSTITNDIMDGEILMKQQKKDTRFEGNLSIKWEEYIGDIQLKIKTATKHLISCLIPPIKEKVNEAEEEYNEEIDDKKKEPNYDYNDYYNSTNNLLLQEMIRQKQYSKDFMKLSNEIYMDMLVNNKQNKINNTTNNNKMNRIIFGEGSYQMVDLLFQAVYNAVVLKKSQAVVVLPSTAQATQYYRWFTDMMDQFNNSNNNDKNTDEISIELLLPKDVVINKKLKKKNITQDINIIIGTNATITEELIFHNLGFIGVVDEVRLVNAMEKVKAAYYEKYLPLYKIRDKYEGKMDCLTLKINSGIPSKCFLPTSSPDKNGNDNNTVSLNKSISSHFLNNQRKKIISGLCLTNEESSVLKMSVMNNIESNIGIMDPMILKDAIDREMNRNGQTLILLPYVEAIPTIVKTIEILCPSAKIFTINANDEKLTIEKTIMNFAYGSNSSDILIDTRELGHKTEILDLPEVGSMIVLHCHTTITKIDSLYRSLLGRSNSKSYIQYFHPPIDMLSRFQPRKLKQLADYLDDLDTKKQDGKLKSVISSNIIYDKNNESNLDMDMDNEQDQVEQRQLAVKNDPYFLLPGSKRKTGLKDNSPILGYELFRRYMHTWMRQVAWTTINNDNNQKVKEKKRKENDECEISTTLGEGIDGFIPLDYIGPHLHPKELKKLQKVKTPLDVDNVRNMWINEYGSLPDPAIILLKKLQIKLAAKALSIDKIWQDENISPGSILLYPTDFRQIHFELLKNSKNFFNHFGWNIITIATEKTKTLNIELHKLGNLSAKEKIFYLHESLMNIWKEVHQAHASKEWISYKKRRLQRAKDKKKKKQ